MVRVALTNVILIVEAFKAGDREMSWNSFNLGRHGKAVMELFNAHSQR